MFDWDQDFDDVTQTRTLAPSEPAKPRDTRRIRRLALRLGASLAVALAIGGGVVATPGVSAAALSSTMLARWLPVFAVAMPEGLLVYDASQFDAFRRGIVGFSDAELLEFERATLLGHQASGLLLADFAHDALLLTHQEIEHRGLTRPVASLRFSTARASL